MKKKLCCSQISSSLAFLSLADVTKLEGRVDEMLRGGWQFREVAEGGDKNLMGFNESKNKALSLWEGRILAVVQTGH